MSPSGDQNVNETRKFSSLNSMHSFIDSNIQLIRNGIYVLGGVGIVIIGRGLYLTKVFTRVEDIPASFIKKQVRLRGRVQKITDEDVLKIEHIPVFKLKVPFIRQIDRKEYLPVHLACIDLSPDGRLWMRNTILNRIVWFHLLHRTPRQAGNLPTLYCKIELPRTFGQNININEELVRKGLARISSLSDIEEVSGVQTNRHLVKYLDTLVKMEDYASKKGRGMWLQSSEQSWSSKGLNVMKYIVSSPFRFVKWMYTRRKKKN